MSEILFDNNPSIFTTGAFLKPLKVTDSEGKKFWVWYVSEFIDETFKNGEIYNPNETGISKRSLLKTSGM